MESFQQSLLKTALEIWCSLGNNSVRQPSGLAHQVGEGLPAEFLLRSSNASTTLLVPPFANWSWGVGWQKDVRSAMKSEMPPLRISLRSTAAGAE